MRQLSAKWVPKCLNANQKRQQCQSSEQILEFFRRDSNDFLSGAIDGYGRNLVMSLWPEDKSTISMEWGIAAHTDPLQKLPGAKMRWKSSRLNFLGSRRHPPLWLSSKWSNYQRGVLLISAGAVEGHFEGKKTRGGKFTKGVLFLHDNAPAQRVLATQKKLAYLGFQCLDHPP